MTSIHLIKEFFRLRGVRALFARHTMLYSPKGNSGSAGVNPLPMEHNQSFPPMLPSLSRVVCPYGYLVYLISLSLRGPLKETFRLQ